MFPQHINIPLCVGISERGKLSINH